MKAKNKKNKNKLLIKGGRRIVSDKVGNYENDPFFVKKAEEDKAFLAKVGMPKELLKERKNEDPEINMEKENKRKNNLLDDIGFVGTQEKLSAAKQKEIQKKTGEAFRKARNTNDGKTPIKGKKTS